MYPIGQAVERTVPRGQYEPYVHVNLEPPKHAEPAGHIVGCDNPPIEQSYPSKHCIGCPPVQ